MNDASISRETLLEIVKGNRMKHHTDYITLVERYRSSLYSVLQKGLKDLQRDSTAAIAGDKSTLPEIELPLVPACFLDDYDTVIRMLELDTREEIVLSRNEFAQLVLDQWAWQGRFSATKTVYGL